MKKFLIRYWNAEFETKSATIDADNIEQAIGKLVGSGVCTQSEIVVWYDVSGEV
jgi:hypothetical protein